MTILDNYDYIVNKIEKAIDHPTLNRFIQRPQIDYDHIWFLCAMFEENGSYSNVEDYITSISLVHLALETHDRILIHPSTNDKERKLRQLTALAGDYYSSKYYQLLADQSDFSMIKQISDAIQKINEDKTSFFKLDLPYGRLFELIKQIESTLLLNVANYLNLPKWKALITDYFYVARLINEKDHYFNGKSTKFLHSILEEKPDLKKGFLQTIDEAVKEGSQRLLNIDIKRYPFIEQLSKFSLFKPEKMDLSLLAEEG
ncbi:heptaprenyl diphosphate synthase component 1 [Pullulanibacillus sp. KACC 23026]|uniref:heptaprenyl diphosphate synthase component 1 n=1 Tax=Pullulanibacillus sp. KACC 23026 TaxID=3028315 RepID=UPI0023AFD35D|nr:heptaprenyl diphosphate synthase component 1 [Pullulanibacillus sp. KACC 23026]WEG11376.1 heptaprenyl diphosphate synthase component 1 [Pullulanibacillus sp. KACC 23026]